MKKYFKTQLKKSISLLMAVLMILSCWVWVAPTQAEAANSPHDGYYYVEVRAWLDDWDNDENVKRNNWIISHAQGTTTLSTNSVYNNGSNDTTGNYVHAYGWVPAFPTGITHEFGQKSSGSGCDITYSGDGWGVRYAAIWVGDGSGTMTQISSSSGGYKTTKEESSYTGSQITDFWGDITPYAASVKTSKGVAETLTMETVPEIGVSGEKSVAFTKAGVYDQYGVRIKDVTGYTLHSDNGGTTDAYTKDDHHVWVDGTNVKADAGIQTALPNANGTQTVYLVAYYESLKATIATVNLTYPSYTVSVDPKGSVTTTGFTPTMDMSDNSTMTGTWTGTGPYTATPTTFPKGTASAKGYTFKGFWTTKQPTSGAAGINASAAEFAEPVNTTAFDTYKAQEGAVLSENNLVVTLSDGSKYYNAGTQWDSTVHKEILGNNTFYGWWIPKDISVKFYNIDGSYMGTQTTKYGSTPGKDWYPNPKDFYNAGAYEYQSFAEQWRDITGVVITEGTYTYGDLETLSLTPIYTTKDYKAKYTITFVNPTGTDDVSKEYLYRNILSGTAIPTYGVPNAIAYDNGYSYEFAGWTTQEPASGEYHIVDKNDTSITANTDWVVRADATYYAIYKSTVKEYVIAFQYTDTTGTVKTDVKYITYGSAITTPADVNRTYATGGYGYTLEGWDYKNKDIATVMLGVDETLVFNDANVLLTAENLKGATTEKPIVFTANYDEGKPTPYTVTFKFKDAQGVDDSVIAEVYHGFNITAETVEELIVPAEYDDGTALYTFSGMWKVTEGTAGKAEYAKEEFTSFSPTSHVTFEAVYGEGVPFYTVTYIDGANTYSERVLAGSNLPAWMVGEGDEAEEYVPADYESETGTYEFAGWFDEEQTDKDYAQTNGTEYTATSTINGDVTLYPQFVFEPFKFTIKFMDYTGKVQLAIAEVEAGQSYEAAFIEAQRAAQYRAPDATYSYTFIGWDYKVPDNCICEGKDMTYTAQYQPNYIYYKASWYKAEDAMTAADLLAVTNHTYEGAVYAPSVNLEIPAGKVFAGWYYKDGENEVAYQRGMTITKDMSFYAKYTDAPKSYTIISHIGDKTYTYSVAEGKNAEVIGTPVDGYIDATSHNDFKGWYTSAEFAVGTEFDIDAKVTANIEVYAKIVVTAHDKSMKELIAAPTYYAKGSEKVWCACSKEDTIATVEIPMLTDTVAPTGVIYLGTQGKWSSTDATGAAATDNDEVTFFANADTDIILTINDTGDVNTAYNPSGVGKGVASIQGIISTGVFGADTTEIAGIQTIFTDSSETLNNTANYVIRLGSYPNLEDGKTYIAYYYVKDKAGNELNRNVRTAKFIYDITAPEFVIEGDCNATTATYCGKAVVKGIEEGATLTLNGEVVTVDGGAYTISEAGNYIVKVTDKAGNSTSKKIKVTDGHDEVTTKKAATCDENGYEKVTCAVCAKIIKNEVITSKGHNYGAVTTVAPTCDEKGYDVQVCSVCGDENKTNEKPAAGHKHEKDAEGNIVYTVITAATCSTEGKKISNCTVCGKDTKTEIIPADANAHVYGATKTLKATCDEAGERYQNCKYCFVKKTVQTLPALNHVDTGRYTKVTTAATCYSEGVETTYCKACDEVMGTAPVAMIAHTLVLVKYEGENNDDVANYPNGYMQYECKATGCTHTEGKTAIAVKATYTVTFKGAGENGADLVITKTEGESIDANAVADQTKAKDNEYEYKFAGWKSSSGKVIKLPVKVTKNETYTAEFTATERVYTHKFLVEGDEFATIVGTYNDLNKKPASVPTKAASDTTKYEFAGWVYENGGTVDSFTMTGDATFKATFTETSITYNVIYIYGTTILDAYTVNASDTVPEFQGDKSKLVKAYDSNYHYEFDEWSITEGTQVYADTYIQPVFEAIKHTYDGGVVTTAPTCTKTGVMTYTCTCGRTKTDSIPTGKHDMEDGVCKHCGFTEAETKVTITFKGDRGTIYSESVTPGTTITYTTVPTKDSTDKYNYTFIGWKVSGTADETASMLTEFTVDENIVYIAVFEDTVRTYTVTYYNGGYPVDKFEGLEYGANIPEYTGAEPTKEYNDREHYVFEGWSINNGPTYTIDKVITEKVTGDTAIYAKFETVAHTLGDVIPGTCSEPAHQLCTGCGYKYVITGTTSVAHTPKEDTVVIKDSTFDETGTKTYYCTSCKQTVVDVIPVKDFYYINIRVWNDDGSDAQYANVKLKHNGEFYDYYEDGKETVDGFVSFKVDKALDKNLWTAYIVGDGITGGISGAVKTARNTTTNINEFNKPENTEPDTPVTPEPEEPEAPECSCSCHKNTFWGMIFRFFQKIIKLFGGKACCADPRT